MSFAVFWEDQATAVGIEPDLGQEITSCMTVENQPRFLRSPESAFQSLAQHPWLAHLFILDTDGASQIGLLHRIGSGWKDLLLHLEREGHFCDAGLGQLFHDQGTGNGNAHADGQTNDGSLKHYEAAIEQSNSAATFLVVHPAEKIVRYVVAMVRLHDLRGCGDGLGI